LQDMGSTLLQRNYCRTIKANARKGDVKMEKTKIEWVTNPHGTRGDTWNPIIGCRNNCPYCYARKIATRFTGTKMYPNGFSPTFFPERLRIPYKKKKPCMFFVCSMGELFGNPYSWVSQVFKIINKNPQHTFVILTKNIIDSEIWFLNQTLTCYLNVWFGVSVDGIYTPRIYGGSGKLKPDYYLWLKHAISTLRKIKRSGKIGKAIVSFEPLLAPVASSVISDLAEFCDWFIIGAQTNPNRQPGKQWVESIVKIARLCNIPVFIKDNLEWPEKIQQLPT